MMTSRKWNKDRLEYLNNGQEVHGFFNIAHGVGGISCLDFVSRKTGLRYLAYPTTLDSGSQDLHPTFIPFSLVTDERVAKADVDVRKVPSGTYPLLRIAQSFDTPESGAPQRGEIFRGAGIYLSRLWRSDGHRLPKDLDLDKIAYIPKNDNPIACVPPLEYDFVADPQTVAVKISQQLLETSHSPDTEELVQEFMLGFNEGKGYKG